MRIRLPEHFGSTGQTRFANDYWCAESHTGLQLDNFLSGNNHQIW
jgi:hypothetical protein